MFFEIGAGIPPFKNYPEKNIVPWPVDWPEWYMYYRTPKRRFPYDSKSMGLIWQFMAHIWPIRGKDMEWLLDCMELIW